jgi:uncharacterized protein
MTSYFTRYSLLLFLALMSGCSSLIFHPEERHYLTPEKLNLKSEDVYFSSDNFQLHGWWLQAAVPAKATIIFLHGNAENISTHIASVYWLPQHGYDVFLFDYRGYGKSQGKPDLDAVHHDYAAALEYVFKRSEVTTLPVFVFGQSLGGAVALVGTAESPYKNQIAAVIVEGTFSTYRGLAREKLDNFWLTWLVQWPLSYTIRDDYRPLDKISQISPTPVLIIHSEDDEIVPYHHGVDLFQSAALPKEFWSLKGISHIHAFTKPEYQIKLLDYLRSQGIAR